MTTDSGILQLANIHGDIAVQLDLGSLAATSLDYDEFGNTTAAARYGWLGSAQRASDTPTGVTLMGARLYDAALGRFLQADPIPDGSANAYEYAGQNPVDNRDLDGQRIKERTIRHCTVYTCVTLRRNCDSSRHMKCSLKWDLSFRKSWRIAIINAGWKWHLYDYGAKIGGGSYNHAEYGSYGFHANWYGNDGSSPDKRGYFRSWGMTFWVDPGDTILFTASGTAWYYGEEYRWSVGQSFSGGGTYR